VEKRNPPAVPGDYSGGIQVFCVLFLFYG